MNTTWRDIDFANLTVDVSPKQDREGTWEWYIKDTERRMLPLTADLVKLVVEHQMSQPEGNPYIFVPMARYEHIRELRRAGQWTVEKGRSPLSKFCHHFNKIRKLAGHAGIETTERFYLAVRTDVVDRARAASEASRKGHSVAHLFCAPGESDKIGKPPCVSALQAKP